jgi:Family of unknown function (DUF6271)
MGAPAVASSVFFIPTNRDCSRAVASYAHELAYARERFGRAIPLVVSETFDGPEAQANAGALDAAARAVPGLETWHLTVPKQLAYFELLLRDEPPEVRDAFLAPRRDYGTAMNKLYLFTCSFGAEALHRRDSDTRLLSDEVPDDRGRYPIEIELSTLGKPASAIEARRRSAPPAGAEDAPICVVGGNYFGEWNLDVKDFARVSYEIVHRLYVILGFDPESVVELVEEIFPREQVYSRRDELTLVAAVNDGPNADCGNVAIARIHEQLPNVPGRNMLAADYFTFDVATALGVPSLHHTRPVFHEYTSGRFEHRQKLVYWDGVARFADYFNVYGPLFENEAVGRAAVSAGSVAVPDDVLERLRNAVEAFPGSEVAARAARIRRLAEEILEPFDERYTKIGARIAADPERLVRECDEDYAAHLRLLERWPALVERAKQIDLTGLLASG